MSDPPATIGPYRILRPLGRGGMGVVYRAEHLDSGQLVALKTVRVPQQSQLSGIRREIHVLARLRHPDIVRILEEGADEHGLPWYAMELAEGITLGRWMRRQIASGPGEISTSSLVSVSDWWTQTLELGTPASLPGREGLEGSASEPGRGAQDSWADERIEGRLSLLRQLCSPLAFLHGEGVVHRDLKLHGEGVVHRDLKPDNVLVRRDGTPLLVDFGLVQSAAGGGSREELDLSGSLLGTVAYMAPEQIRGELVDARADLYSLGCILYELLTGRPPFVDATPRGVLAQHLERVPEPPSRHNASVPLELDALVLRLLAKSPRQRLGHAAALASALEALGARDRRAAAEQPQPRAYLYRPGFAGRGQTLQGFERRLGELEAGGGGLVLVGGESGVGKTRLMLELAQAARRWLVRVLAGECFAGVGRREAGGGSDEKLTGSSVPLRSPVSGLRSLSESARAPRGRSDRSPLPSASGVPLQALRKPLQQVADRCSELGQAETERLLGRRGKLLALYEPALAGLPGQEAHPEPAELPAEAARIRLFSFLTETFEALAAERPVLLLDDLQWADELTLGWLELLLRGKRLARCVLLVVGAYRSEETGEGLHGLLQAKGAERLELGRLEDGAVAAMVGDMLALEPSPPRLSRHLARHSEGNPFFVAEYLRAAVEEGLLWRDAAGDWQAAEADYERLGLPRSLRELVERRLQGLPPEAAELVRAAAVLGREVEVKLLGRMTGLAGDRLAEAGAELLRRQVLEEPEPGLLRFTHDKLREMTCEGLEAEERRRLHGKAAGALEELPSDEQDQLLGALGQHWELAGEADKARASYLADARKAVSRHALAEAERLYRAYLGLVHKPTSESVSARHELGDQVLRGGGKLQEAISELRQAWQEAEALGVPASHGFVLADLGLTFSVLCRFDEAQEALGRALGLARSNTDRVLEAQTLLRLGSVQSAQGTPDASRQLYLQALQLAQTAQDLSAEAEILNALSILEYEQGAARTARNHIENALPIAGRLGDVRLQGRLLGNLGRTYLHEKRFVEVLGHSERARLLLQESGDRLLEWLCLGNIGWLLILMGRIEEGSRRLRDSIQLLKQIGAKRLEALMQANLAVVEHRVSGHLSLATKLLHESADTYARLGDAYWEAQCLCALGHIELAQGRSAQALLERSMELLKRLGAGPESVLAERIAMLRRAMEAAEAGRPLFRGICPEDLEDGIRRWLIEKGEFDERLLRPPAQSGGKRGRGARADASDPSGPRPKKKAPTGPKRKRT
jgi:serine/threonine protein kinase/predicted ATPase